MFAGVGDWSTGGSGWKVWPRITRGCNGSGGRRGCNGHRRPGVSDHGLLEASGSCYELSIYSRLRDRFHFDQTMDGRSLKFLNVIDEYSRLCLAIRVGRRCRAAEVIDTIEELLKLYSPPTHLRMDNGPEFIANALQEWSAGNGCNTACIPPGSPWENPFVDSFKSRFRDEFMNIELFSSVQEAKFLAEQHRIEYHTYRLHSAL